MATMSLPNLNASVAGNLTSPSQASVFDVTEFAFVVRSLFYLVSPNETTYQTVDEVPNYFLKVFSTVPNRLLNVY